MKEIINIIHQMFPQGYLTIIPKSNNYRDYWEFQIKLPLGYDLHMLSQQFIELHQRVYHAGIVLEYSFDFITN